ncbi:Transposase [Pseudomonas syringae pv. daphniphylli]|uniref:Transposase n=1 Tax=Pseudomonas syringae pv. daphniphylli TaxID=264455 RepID=A0A9X0H224_PSESX|nr:Transposase [Pseudomonas syringae pv. daphniphylli]
MCMEKRGSARKGLPVVHTRAAGVDIGSRFHVVAVPAHLAESPVQTFNAFTAELDRIAD